MSKNLLEVCNDWQIERAMILERNPDMRKIVAACDLMIEQAVVSARQIANAVDFDKRHPVLKDEP